MKWVTEYDNDVKHDGYFSEWWDVTNGERIAALKQCIIETHPENKKP